MELKRVRERKFIKDKQFLQFVYLEDFIHLSQNSLV